jgi:diphosphoinositol-polyphosphate diphosphatase
LQIVQVYSKQTGARVVAGTVVLNHDKTKVLMVSATKQTDRWVLPKGGVELDEIDDHSQSAIRETWEEAGVIGKITNCLGVIEDARPPKTWANKQNNGGSTWPPRSEFHFYEMEFEKAESVYPESSTRTRKWVTYREANAELIEAKRPELKEALDRSSITKTL